MRPDGSPPGCDRPDCNERPRYRPSFVFAFTNGAHRHVAADVALCAAHGEELRQRFASDRWQGQFDASLPPGCSHVDWPRSRVWLNPA
jgi:hypothetical protein